jgi:hypothetical protein
MKTNKAMIATCSVSLWEGMTTDRKVTGEIVTSKHSSQDAGLWTTRLVPKNALKPVKNAGINLRNVHKRFTLPWLDNGGRILPIKMYMKYAKAMRSAKDAFDDAVNNFLKIYPKLLEQKEIRLGELAKNASFPNISELRYKFNVETSLFPLSDASDFRAEVLTDSEDILKKQIQKSFEKTCAKAHADIYSRIKELISKLHDTLKEKDKVFRDTLFTNIKDFVDIMSDLNFTEDPHIEELKTDINALLKISPDTVRISPEARSISAQYAENIQKKIDTYFPA